jgi:hypothetical protein
VRRLELRLQLLAHRLIGLQIVALAGEQPHHRCLVVLIRLDSQLAAVVPVGNQGLVELLHGEREREVLGVAVADIAHQPVKYAI